MIKNQPIRLIILLFSVQMLFAQQRQTYYLPYDLPGHTSAKFNSFLMNPAFPILGEKESHIALSYRNQWSNFRDHFSSFGITYGRKWSDENMFHTMLFSKQIGVFSNYGLLGNYIHQVEVSDDNYLRLGVNGMFGMSGISQDKVHISDLGDPLLANAPKTMIVNIQPGFDINFGNVHFGIFAENLIDYAVSAGEMAVPFNQKSFSGHLMYRYEISSAGILDEAVLSLMARARQTAENTQFGGNAMLDLPTMGWLYAGYNQKFGVFGGIGFNVNSHISVSFGYEQSVGAYVNNLGSTYDIVLAYRFGGNRQAKERQLRNEKAAKEAKLAALKAQRDKKPEEETTPAPTTQTPPTPKPQKPQTPAQILAKRLKVQDHKIAGGKIAEGHYIVAGVYRNPKGAFQLLTNIRNLGITANTFVHPENGMTYVYFNQPIQDKGEAGLLMQEMLKRPEFANTNIWVLRVSK